MITCDGYVSEDGCSLRAISRTLSCSSGELGFYIAYAKHSQSITTCKTYPAYRQSTFFYRLSHFTFYTTKYVHIHR